MDQEIIGFAGLGGMGSAIAGLLCALDGHKVRVYNRSIEKLDTFIKDRPDSATPATSPANLTPCTLTFSCLANDEAVEAVVTSYLEGVAESTSTLPLPRLFVDMSTVLPSTTRRLAALAEKQSVTYLSCPVFGRPPAAAAGQLIACISGGDESCRARVKAVAAAFAGRGIHDLGPDVGAGHALKLTGNFYIAGQIELAAEVLALAAKSGIADGPVLSIIQGIAGGGIASGYAHRMAAGDYDASSGFAVDLGLKDVSHVRTLAREVTCPVPVADLAFNHLLTAKARHGGGLDWGALALAVREAAGLDPNIVKTPNQPSSSS